MPDHELLALLDQVDATLTPAPASGADPDLMALLDAVEAAPAPQHRPVAAGAGQAFQNASASLGQMVLAAPALLEAGVRRFVGPAPSASDITPLGSYLALREKQDQADEAQASYDERPGMAGLGQEVLEGAAGSVPSMILPVAAGVTAKVAPTASRVAQAAARVRASSGIAGLNTTAQGVQKDPTLTGVANAVTQGILEAAFMRLGGATGVEAILRKSGPEGVRQGLRAAIATVAREGGQEMPEEGLTALTQDAADQLFTTGTFDPRRNLRAGAVGAGAGAVMGAGMNAGPAVQAGARRVADSARALAESGRALTQNGMGQARAEIAAAGREVSQAELEQVLADVPDDMPATAVIGDRRGHLRDQSGQTPAEIAQVLATASKLIPPTTEGLNPANDDMPLPQLDPLLAITPTEVGNLARLDRGTPETEEARWPLDVIPSQATTTGAEVGIRRPDLRPEFATTTGIQVPIQEAPRAQAPAAAPPAGPVPGSAPAPVGAAPAPQAPVARQPKGWQQFAPETGTLNIPRAQMPQIQGGKRGALANFLRARDISWKREEVDPAQLKPTQAEWNPAKVAKANRSLANDGNQARAILVSADNHVIDGHHQMIAAQQAGKRIPVVRIGANIREALAAIREFPSTLQAAGASPVAAAAAPPQPEANADAPVPAAPVAETARQDAPRPAAPPPATQPTPAKPVEQAAPTTPAPETGERTAPRAPEQPAPAATVPNPDERIGDLGEKIGGARKDTAVSTGPKPKREKPADERPAWARRYEVGQIVASMNKTDEGRWSVRDSKNTDWKGQARDVGGKTFATKAEAEAAVPLAEARRTHRVQLISRTGEAKEYGIVRRVSDTKRKTVKRGFASDVEAERYLAEHPVKIIETETSFGEEILAKPDTVKRVGAERRQGDVKPQDFMETFGFRGVEFGNWNNQVERQEVMNHAFDAMHDLAEIIGIPPKALSLNGELALAFGARGHGLAGARAHYEAIKVVINLTKMKGAGALAHEWWHGLDHYLARQDGKTTAEMQPDAAGGRRLDLKGSASHMASEGTRGERSGIRAELRQRFQALLETINRKAVTYVEDTAAAESFVGRQRDALDKRMAAVRGALAKERQYGAKKGAATAEQLARWDAAADALLSGDPLPVEWKTNPSGKAIAMRWANPHLDALEAVHKEVTGRSGRDSQDHHGAIDGIATEAKHYVQRVEMLKQAQAGEEKTRKVPTTYVLDAKEADQGRATDYWTEPTELGARAFSAFVEDSLKEKGGASAFLSFGSDNWRYKLADLRPFPEGAERTAINQAFRQFLDTIKTETTPRGTVRLYAPERKLDDQSAGPVVVKSDALGTTGNLDVLHQRAREWIKANLDGKTLTAPNGLSINRFSSNHLSSKAKTSDEIRALTAIPAILAAARWNASMPDKHGRSNIRAVHQYEAPVRIGKTDYIAGITVLEEKGGGIYYEQRLLSKDRSRPAPAPPGPDSTGDQSGLVGARPADDTGSVNQEEGAGKQQESPARLQDEPGKLFAPERTARSDRGRIPVAAIMPVEAKDAERITGSISGAIATLREEFRRRGVGDPQLAAGEAPKGAAGMFDEATGAATLYRSNDLDASGHELGHQVAWKYRFDAEDVPGETDFFAKSGSQAPPNLTGKDLRDYRAKEAWAEFIRAWIVNPEATEAQAPQMTKLFTATVPKPVQQALADFGRFGRQFMGLPAAARTQANIEQTEALIEAGSTVRAMASMFNLGEAMQAARGERGAWLKLRAFLAKAWKGARLPLAPPGTRNGALSTDEIKAYKAAIKEGGAGGRWAAFRWSWQNVWFPAYQRFSQAMEIRGRQVKPEQDFRILNRLLAGTDGKVLEQVFGSGLRDSRNRPAIDEKNGENLTFGWILDPISKSVDTETGEVVGVTPGAFTRLINKALAYGVELRTYGRGSKLIEQADKDAERFVTDLDAFVGGTADLGVLDDIERRWTAAGLDPAKGRQMRVIASRLTKMMGEKGAPDARILRKFTEAYGEKVREIAAEKAARLSGIGAGLTSDFRQAQKAIAERDADPDKPAMDEFLRRYRRWAQHLVQYLTETGVFTGEQAQAMLEADTWTDPETGETLDFYIDMHRIFERDGSNIMPGRAFTGSTRAVRNPLANLLEATLNAIANGDRNRAMASLADAFRNRDATGAVMDDVRDSRLGEWGRQIAEDVVQEARRAGQPTINGRIPYVIKNNGVREFWTFDPWIESSIEAARRQGGDGNLLLRMWATATRVMRTGITTFPSFMMRNLARDLQARFVVSESGKGTGLADIFRGFKRIETQGRQERVDTIRKVAGASYAGYNDGRVQIGQALAQHLDSLIRPGAGGKAARVVSPMTLLRLTERANEWFEATNRNAEVASAYRQAKALGYDDFNAQLYAADKARGLIDFAEAGVFSRQLNRAILFVNPAIQGLARFARTWDQVRERAATGKTIPHKMALALTSRAAVTMGLMTAAAIALRLLKDDEEEEKWRQQDPTVRDFHWHVPIEGFPDIAVARPYDFGFLLAGAERIADAVMAHRQGNQAQVDRAMEGYAKSAMGALLPVNDVSSLLGGFAPLVEAGFNYDPFRGRHIIPTWEEGADLRLRDTDKASAVGKLLQQVTGQDARLMDHIIEGYAGNWGRAATSVGKPADWWLGTLTGMFKNDPAGAARDVQWVYDEATRLRLGSSKPVRQMTALLKEARNGKTTAEREQLAEKARRYAAGVRNAWEKSPPKVIAEK